MKLFWGKVVQGAKRGKQFGFPTANIAMHREIPEGIYLSKVCVGKKWHNALTFIGKAAMFGQTKRKAESYLLDFSDNLYGKFVTVQLLQKIRDNKRFDSEEALVVQMQADLVIARKFFAPWC